MCPRIATTVPAMERSSSSADGLFARAVFQDDEPDRQNRRAASLLYSGGTHGKELPFLLNRSPIFSSASPPRTT